MPRTFVSCRERFSHVMSANAATNALDNGVYIAKVQEWLGQILTRPEDSPTFKVSYNQIKAFAFQSLAAGGLEFHKQHVQQPQCCSQRPLSRESQQTAIVFLGYCAADFRSIAPLNIQEDYGMKLLKKDVNAQSANIALNEFRRIVGDEWVFSSDEDVALYRDYVPPYFWNWGSQKVADIKLA